MPLANVLTDHPSFRRFEPFFPFLTFLLVAALFSLGSYHAFRQIEYVIQSQKLEDLDAVADMKVAQIVAWLDRQKRRGEMMNRASLLTAEFDQWRQAGMPQDARQKKIARVLGGMQSLYGYKTVMLFDRNGVARISADGNLSPDPDDTALALQVMGSRSGYLSDLHRRPGTNEIVLDLAAPLVSDKSGKIVGAMLFIIDPYESLYPLVQSWPAHSRSAETLIARKDGDDILFLNELRFHKGAALALRKPVSAPNLPSAMAFRGMLGAAEGVDYRGVPVVSSTRRVPDTPWVLVAKVDKDELFKPLNELEQWATGLGFAFIAVGSALVFVWLRGYLAKYSHLQAQYQSAVERQALESRFKHLVKHANDMILVADENGRIIEANDRAVEMFGYSREELVRMSLTDLRPTPEEADVLARQLERLGEQGAQRYETVTRRKDGTVFPVEVSLALIDIGGVKYIQGISRDITQRKRAEAELRFRSEIISHMEEGIVLVRTSDGAIAYANPKYEQMFGYEPGELEGQPISVVNATSDKSPDEVAQEILAVLEQEGCWQGEVLSRRKDGSHFWSYAVVSKFEHHAYGPIWISVQRDITELKELEALRNQRQMEMAHAQRLNVASEMTYGLTHELSQPLTAAHTYIDACLRRLEGGEYDAEKQIRCLSLAHIQTERAGKVINHFKGLISKRGRDVAPLEVNPLIQEAAEFLEYEIRRHQVMVHLDLHPVPAVMANSIEIEQVVLNLMRNAIDAMKEAPEKNLRLSSRPARGGGVQVEVSDSGNGISVEGREHLFDQFYTTKSDGLGLGLAICQSIIHAHNGKIWVESVVGRGSTFSFTLPERASKRGWCREGDSNPHTVTSGGF